MKIANNTVVSFHYQLREVGGNYTEDSTGGDPMLYLHGHRGILPGLEDHMLGKEPGESFSVTLSPEQAYGARNSNGIQRVPLKHLINESKPAVGSIVTVNTRKGRVQATVVKTGRFNVDIDTNHPLAGKQLAFDVQVLDVREATLQEVTQRRAAQPG